MVCPDCIQFCLISLGERGMMYHRRGMVLCGRGVHMAYGHGRHRQRRRDVLRSVKRLHTRPCWSASTAEDTFHVTPLAGESQRPHLQNQACIRSIWRIAGCGITKPEHDEQRQNICASNNTNCCTCEYTADALHVQRPSCNSAARNVSEMLSLQGTTR